MAVLVKTINSLSYASVKTWGGLAVASIKNINGLDATSPSGIAFIAESSGFGTGNDATTPAIDTTGADLLVVVTAYLNGSTGTISDSKSNTWNDITLSSISFTTLKMSYCVPSSVGASHTFTVTGTNTFAAISVMAFSGVNSTPLDQQNANSATSATSATTGSITPSVNNSLLIAGIGIEATYSALSMSGYTVGTPVSYSSGNHFGGAMAYKIQGTAAADNPTWSWTSLATVATKIANFKPV